jgi:serine phosphatase RsbU (regulator of sigma subunit)
MTQGHATRFHHEVPGYEIWGCRLPSEQDVGDLVVCEPIPTPRDLRGRAPVRWFFAVGEVSGIGGPARRHKADLEGSVRRSAGSDLAAILGRWNRDICAAGDECRFDCLVLGLLDGEGHEVTLGNAGHFAPFVRRVEGGVATIGEEIAGIPLGVDPAETYRTTALTLRPGEVLVFHSGGFTAIINSECEILTCDQLRSAIADAAPDAASVGLGVLRAAASFGVARHYRFDLSLIGIGRVIDPTAGAASHGLGPWDAIP